MRDSAAFKEGTFKIHANMRDGTPTQTLWQALVQHLRADCGAVLLPGVPPAGDLERKIHAALDEMNEL